MALELYGLMGEAIDSLTMIPGSKGVFSVYANGDLIFSKNKEDRFPEVLELWELLNDKLE